MTEPEALSALSLPSHWMRSFFDAHAALEAQQNKQARARPRLTEPAEAVPRSLLASPLRPPPGARGRRRSRSTRSCSAHSRARRSSSASSPSRSTTSASLMRPARLRTATARRPVPARPRRYVRRDASDRRNHHPAWTVPDLDLPGPRQVLEHPVRKGVEARALGARAPVRWHRSLSPRVVLRDRQLLLAAWRTRKGRDGFQTRVEGAPHFALPSAERRPAARHRARDQGPQMF